MPLLIGPATVATCGRWGVMPDAGVLVEAGVVVAVDRFDKLAAAHPGAERLDARGGLVLPGLTNAHTHFYGLLARGFAFPGPAPTNFRQVLEQVWWRLDRGLTREAVYLSALYGMVDSLRCGVTALVDHHASPSAIAGSLDDIARAALETGVRACLCYEVTDRNGPDGATAGIAENLRFIRAARNPKRLAAKFGLHASFTLSDGTLAACRTAAAQLGEHFPGFHIHLAEGPEDPTDSLKRSGRRTAHRLAEAGILGPGTFVGHGVHLDDEEVALLASSGVTLTHQPHSNMGNAVGWPRILHMRERGVKVALGTDGYTPDMLETLRTAATFHSHATQAPGSGVGEFASVLLADNPAVLSKVFGVTMGRLEPWAAADLVVTDYCPPTPVTADNLGYHVHFGLSAAHVRSVVVAGRIVVLDGAVAGLDEAALAAELRDVAGSIWKSI